MCFVQPIYILSSCMMKNGCLISENTLTVFGSNYQYGHLLNEGHKIKITNTCGDASQSQHKLNFILKAYKSKV